MGPIVTFLTGLKIRFPTLENVQCRAKFHVDFSETEGNFALYCIQFPLHFLQRRLKEIQLFSSVCHKNIIIGA